MNRKIDYKIDKPDRIISYFIKNKFLLLLVLISGLIYNIGLLANPYFEGQLTQTLYDVLFNGEDGLKMVYTAIYFLIAILVVQGMRAIKRYTVRIFANDISASMRHTLYHSLINMDKEELDNENLGSLMTKAVSDVEVCSEGIRKFTTEVFDTGVAMIAYATMMFIYDFKLALISLAFVPLAYLIAMSFKKLVTKANIALKKSASDLNFSTQERIKNAITYRTFGLEKNKMKEWINS